jgi:hypothetical protein
MSTFDTSVPIVPINEIFLNYTNRIQIIKENLLANFNFGYTSTNLSYNDFWDSITHPVIVNQVNYTLQFNHIAAKAQIANDIISDKYMNLVGMVMALDNYLCYVTDAFSRIVDSAWSFGDGSIYQNGVGKLLPDGTYDVVKVGVSNFSNKINATIIEIEQIVNDMDRTLFDDMVYLQLKKDEILIKIQDINTFANEAGTYIQELVEFSNQLVDALEIWLPETFRLVGQISLAFNLSKKMEHLTNKVLNPTSTRINSTTLIAISSANLWKKEVLPNMTNRGHCMTEAILTGCRHLIHPGRLKSFIEKSWDLMIPKYT